MVKMMKKEKRNEKSGRKRFWAAVLTVLLLCGMTALPKGEAEAQEAPFVDISTAVISLSPQVTEAKMNVAARNLPEGTVLGVSVADTSICTVEWVDVEGIGYRQLCYKRGAALGETVATVFVADNPAICRQITVTNKDVADSYVYEGNGSQVICGVNMPELPYAVHAVSTDADGYFGLLYYETSGDMRVLVNAVGAYDGVSTIPQGTNGGTLQVLATGKWQITMTPVLSGTEPTQSGTGSTVTGRFKGDGKAHDVYCSNQALKGNYIVWLYDINDNTRQLLANGAGNYGKTKKGIFLVDYHSYYYSVQSEGNWLVEFR